MTSRWRMITGRKSISPSLTLASDDIEIPAARNDYMPFLALAIPHHKLIFAEYFLQKTKNESRTQ